MTKPYRGSDEEYTGGVVLTDAAASTTFVPNQSQAVHRWFRYSAGFSAAWAEAAIRSERTRRGRPIRVLDPFAGVGTSVLAAQAAGCPSIGIEAHPFVHRIAAAKLRWPDDPAAFLAAIGRVVARARASRGRAPASAELLRRIYDEPQLAKLVRLRSAVAPEDELCWLALASILRACSHAGTAPWQYVLPKQHKRAIAEPFDELAAQAQRMAADMCAFQTRMPHPADAAMLSGDARTCDAVERESVELVLTSPPYPNNYDYADATRIEMSFFGQVASWADLHGAARRHLVRSCSQHTAKDGTRVADVVASPLLAPIRPALDEVCAALSAARLQRAGKKTYDSMVAAYFDDMARVIHSLARVMRRGARACLVIGDSAPYGVHVPVDVWFARLAGASGFAVLGFEQTRERNLKWKNRKHRVPLREGRLWLERG